MLNTKIIHVMEKTIRYYENAINNMKKGGLLDKSFHITQMIKNDLGIMATGIDNSKKVFWWNEFGHAEVSVSAFKFTPIVVDEKPVLYKVFSFMESPKLDIL